MCECGGPGLQLCGGGEILGASGPGGRKGDPAAEQGEGEGGGSGGGARAGVKDEEGISSSSLSFCLFRESLALQEWESRGHR